MASNTTSFIVTPQMKKRLTWEASRVGTSQSKIINRALAEYFARRNGRNVAETWEPDDSDFYDETRIFSFGEDRKGHSAYLRVMIPKNLAGEITALVESGDIPEYRTKQHFYRDAIFHRAKQVARWIKNGDLEREADMAMALSTELALQQEWADAEALIDQTRNNCNKLLARGNIEFLKDYLAKREGIADTISENYREEYLAVIAEFKQRVGENVEGPLRIVN